MIVQLCLLLIRHFFLFFVSWQIDIDDSYGTLTNKTVASVMWAIGYCGRHFTFLLKTDEDSFNVLPHFVEYLDSLDDRPAKNNLAFVGGYCSSGETLHRGRTHVWFVPHSSYPAPVLPLHCKVSVVQSGLGVVLKFLKF